MSYTASMTGEAVVPRLGWRTFSIGVFIVLAGTTLLQRVGYVISEGADEFQATQIQLSLALTYLGLLFMWLSGHVYVDLRRLMLFAFGITALLSTLLLSPKPFSFLSIALGVVMYIPFIAVCPIERARYLKYLRWLNYILVPLAVLAMVQFAWGLLGMEWPDFFTMIFPKKWQLVGYNTYAVVDYESQFRRANAEVFLEPSFASQWFAVGILAEFIFLRNFVRLGLLCGGIIATLSGTGLVLLGVFAILTMIQRRMWHWLILLVLLAMAAQFIPHDTPLGRTLGRADELSSRDASGFQRFIGPILAIDVSLQTDFANWLFGLGPGTARSISLYGLTFNPFPFSKLMIEYGLLGTVTMGIFLVYCWFSHAFSGLLAGALFLQFNLLGDYFLSPQVVYFAWIVSVLFIPVLTRDETRGTLAAT